MSKVSMTEDGLNAIRPSTTGSVKQMFYEDDEQAQKTNKKLNSEQSFEV